MNPDQLKNHMANLSEKDQDALAQLTLTEMKKRERLESIASGSWATKLALITPIIFSVALLSFREKLSDLLPIILVFLVFVIQAIYVSIHSRINAIYELMKADQQTNNSSETQKTEKGTPSRES